jgi:N-(2-amino-2-carboxyethyl)-L-glutamate synthase
MNTFPNILAAVGHTPLVRLGKLFGSTTFEVFAKCEGFNPGGSGKDRPARAMIEAGLASGEIRPGSVVIESSSGNMGIGLAQACRYFELRFICVVDPRTTAQNIAMLRAYGAEVDVVPAPDPVSGEWLQARIARVHTLLAEIPGAVWVDQYSNPANPRAHGESTILEILDALDGRLDYLFCAVSTCGTLSGCAAHLRRIRHPARVIAVDALGSAIFSSQRIPRPIPGLGAGIRPPLLDSALVDECVHVTAADCVVGCHRLARVEGMLAGGSAGGVIRGIERVASRIAPGSLCVAILPDRGERYLDTIYNDAWVREHCGATLQMTTPTHDLDPVTWTIA